MSLLTNNQRSPQVSFQSIVQCVFHYYILITIYFCICAFTFTSPLAFCVCVSTLSSPSAFAFMFLHFHHLVPFMFVFFAFSSEPFYLFAFLHFQHYLLSNSKAPVCVIMHLRYSCFQRHWHVWLSIWGGPFCYNLSLASSSPKCSYWVQI